MRPISAKRRAEAKARREAVQIAFERDDYRCQWSIRVAALPVPSPPSSLDEVLPRDLMSCYGPPTPHEPKGKRNVDRTDPDEIVTLCQWHNDCVEDYPNLARVLGLRPENRAAYPVSHVEVKG